MRGDPRPRWHDAADRLQIDLRRCAYPLFVTPLTILIGAIGVEPMVEKLDRIKTKLGLIVQPDYFTDLAYRFCALRQKQRKYDGGVPNHPLLCNIYNVNVNRSFR